MKYTDLAALPLYADYGCSGVDGQCTHPAQIRHPASGKFYCSGHAWELASSLPADMEALAHALKRRMNEYTVRVHFIDGTERIVPAKDFHWHEEGARSATAIVDGREVPIYRRSEPEWGPLWHEQAVRKLLTEGLPVYHLLSYHICSYRKGGTIGCVLLSSHDKPYLERLMHRLMKAYWRDAPHSPMPGQVGIYYVKSY